MAEHNSYMRAESTPWELQLQNELPNGFCMIFFKHENSQKKWMINQISVFICQIMLVDGYKGQKVQDVKKPIQKMMVEKVKHLLLLECKHWASSVFSMWLVCTVCVCYDASSVTGRGHDLHGARKGSHVPIGWWVCRCSVWPVVSEFSSHLSLFCKRWEVTRNGLRGVRRCQLVQFLWWAAC